MQHITLKINLPNKRLDSNNFLCRRVLDTIGMMMEVVTERASAGSFNSVVWFLIFDPSASATLLILQGQLYGVSVQTGHTLYNI